MHGLFAGFGWICAWPLTGRREGAGAESYFFAAGADARDFDDLRDGDRVSFAVRVPQPAKGPRATDVQRESADG